ncbi:MAG: DNA-directed RNA polymerase subunit beta' [Fusobacteriota bacterium]
MGIKNFEKVRIGLLSPEKIKKLSFGEVTKPETINYRTLKPEVDGLFCEKIFGPVKDWECACGKYKRMRYKGLVCEKCGVEVTKSKVRRERMGHLKLAAPVAHIWYSRGIPNKMALLLGISSKELEAVLYFAKYIVINAGETSLKKGEILTEREYKLYKSQYGNKFKALMGAEAIKKVLAGLDLNEEEDRLKVDLEEVGSKQKRKKIIKRLKIVRDFLNSKNKPEWLIMDYLPIIPADLRPMVQLDGGRFATSDLNDLYRRVINRNNRLKKLIDIHAPGIVVKNEKRMLQEAVDALIDNGRRGRTVVTQKNRELKSLSDMLKGKQGRFRQNLLGKRVDYSGRSVIVVGPDLKMDQCGIPKEMALELYKPFIMKELIERDITSNIKTAKKMVENGNDKVWPLIEEVIKDHPILLNRAPSLHRLSIQAFQPVLIEGKAIRLHPLVCNAFNADFDGDQMAVHLVLSVEAKMEAKLLMTASRNIIAPSSGEPIAVPSQDMVMGCYYMTKERKGQKGEGKTFSNVNQAMLAHDSGKIDVQALIKVRIDGELVETTVGRIMFNEILPKEIRYYKKTFGKGELKKIIAELYKKFGFAISAEVINEIKNFGFHYAAIAGITIGVEDLDIPEAKKGILEKADKDVEEVEKEYKAGKLINEERYRKTVDIWDKAIGDVTNEMMSNLDEFNPVYMMANSGARGNTRQMRQLGGMRGLMADTQGQIIEIPIKANFREGLNILEFFMSTHGARKGLADTALRTADSGYLTRRLVDVSHDVIINEDECNAERGIIVSDLISEGIVIEKLAERITGRHLATDLIYDGEVLYPKNTLLTEEKVQKIGELDIEAVEIRSPLTCTLEKGVCQKCYGIDLSDHKDVLLGEAVGVIAAQSIGEPGTQLTMRTFHTGGVAEKGETQSMITSEVDGEVKFVDVRYIEKDGNRIVTSQSAKFQIKDKEYEIPSGSILDVNEGDKVENGDRLVEFDPYQVPIIAEEDGIIEYREVHVKEHYDEKYDVIERTAVKPAEHGDTSPRMVIFDHDGDDRKKLIEYTIPYGAYLFAKDNEKIKKGDIIAKIVKKGEGTKDITGGLPRIQELFEARNPKGKAILSKSEGIVKLLDKKKKGMRVVQVKPVDENKKVEEYKIPFGEHLVVMNGMKIAKGAKLTGGPISPHDILSIMGLVRAEQYILEAVQGVYREQGVTINDKHIEIIVKQMFRKEEITDPGDSLYLKKEIIDRNILRRKNKELREQEKKEIKSIPVIQGITKAAVNTESFLSAASFQETKKVLSNAALAGKEDNLEGLKENVILGKQIPAGTGFRAYENVDYEIKDN